MQDFTYLCFDRQWVYRTISDLPMACVDTGAGLERFAMVLQDAASIHQIDQYTTAYNLIADDLRDLRWSRIVLDHLKSSLLMLNEGVLPGTQRESYVLRRLLRRIMVGMYLAEIDLGALVNYTTALAETMDQREQLASQLPVLRQAIELEAKAFGRVLQQANKHLAKIKEQQSLSGDEAFHLKASYGIPDDLMREFCLTNQIIFPDQDLQERMEIHRSISRS